VHILLNLFYPDNSIKPFLEFLVKIKFAEFQLIIIYSFLPSNHGQQDIYPVLKAPSFIYVVILSLITGKSGVTKAIQFLKAPKYKSHRSISLNIGIK